MCMYVYVCAYYMYCMYVYIPLLWNTSDIYNGNRKLIMAVIWALIHHYQISGRISGKTPRIRSGAHAAGDKVDTTKYTKKLSPDQQLLMWTQARVRPFGVDVTNFTTR
jgi:hypothetical protein